jgi:hypothetical protein
MKFSSSLFALFALIACAAERAGADPIVDQQNTSTNSIFILSSMAGQSFTPGLNGIDFATFSLRTEGASSTVVLNLFQGAGYGGTLLGSSAAVVITNSSFQTVEFDYASTIALTPGQVYTMQIKVNAGSLIDEDDDSSNPYSGGTEYSSGGVAVAQYDMVFSEGINAAAVPEPSSLVMCGIAGVVGLVVARRRRQRTA